MKAKKQTVWVVTGTSESSDSYGPFVLSSKPTVKKMEQIARSCDWSDGEEMDGPGDFGSYTYLSLFKCQVGSKQGGVFVRMDLPSGQDELGTKEGCDEEDEE